MKRHSCDVGGQTQGPGGPHAETKTEKNPICAGTICHRPLRGRCPKSSHGRTDGQIDGRTDRQTDTPSFRDAMKKLISVPIVHHTAVSPYSREFIRIYKMFLDASSHLYKNLCLSFGSVCPYVMLLSTRPSRTMMRP